MQKSEKTGFFGKLAKRMSKNKKVSADTDEIAPSADVEARPVAEEIHQETPVVEEIAEQASPKREIIAPLNYDPDDFACMKYNKSFVAKLILANDENKAYYDRLKNYMLGYKGVSVRTSWNYETFKQARNKIARLTWRGKSLYLYLALDPDDYAATKYKVERAETSRYEDYPCLYRMINARRIKYAEELIDIIMQKYGAAKKARTPQNFSAEYPSESLQSLIERGLVKVNETSPSTAKNSLRVKSVASDEVAAMMTDEEAQRRVETANRVADRTKKGIVNIDVLSQAFKDGEYVTLEEMKKRVRSIPPKTTYIKVLARGTLNKRLTVLADEFSADAVKMILLTGGKAIRTSR